MLIDPYGFRPARIAEIVREAPRAVSVRLAADTPYDFRVGQHVVVRVTMPDGTKLVRQYSFSAPPSGTDIWLTIVEEPDGQVSGWFNKTAKVGDTVEISHPFTGPLMQNTPRGEICMIAGGSGIAPLMAWVETLRAQQAPFRLLYSTRSDERCFADRLAPRPHETITVRLTDNEARFTQEEVIRNLTDQSTVFICGSRPFVLAMRTLCETIVPPHRIHAEAFNL